MRELLGEYELAGSRLNMQLRRLSRSTYIDQAEILEAENAQPAMQICP